MWKNSLKYVESDNNKISKDTVLNFLQRNGTYIMNKPLIIIMELQNLLITKLACDVNAHCSQTFLTVRALGVYVTCNYIKHCTLVCILV